MQPTRSVDVLSDMHRRPSAWIRVTILFGAIACLALTMCHSEQTAQRAPSNPPAQPASSMATQPTQHTEPGGGVGVPMQAAPPSPTQPKLLPRYFSASKAPGSLR